MASIYTLDDIEFLKKNYPIFGSDYCAKQLGRDRKAIKVKCINLGIKFDIDNYYDNINRKVDHKQFINVDNKYTAYILGFIWADGYIGKKEIQVLINTKDLDDIKKIFLYTGEWRMYSDSYIDKRTNKEYDRTRIVTKNQLLSKFLIDNDYKDKSQINCDKILNKIPNNLKSHFFRGFFDGDGCFYYNKKCSSYNCFFTSSYDQEWSSVETLLKSLDIKYNISRKIGKKGKHSTISIQNKNDIDIFANYIYNEWEHIGLERKFNYYKSFSDNSVIRHIEQKWSNDDLDYLMKNYNGKNIKDVSTTLNRNTTSVLAKFYKQNKIKNYESFIGFTAN